MVKPILGLMTEYQVGGTGQSCKVPLANADATRYTVPKANASGLATSAKAQQPGASLVGPRSDLSGNSRLGLGSLPRLRPQLASNVTGTRAG